MKKATMLVPALALALHCSLAAAQGTVSGTLHRATLREWHQANPANQFATVSDIVEGILNLRDPLAIAPMARDVQACISRISANFTRGNQAVTDTAIACMAELGFLPRR
jgi:hypothetical protein